MNTTYLEYAIIAMVIVAATVLIVTGKVASDAGLGIIGTSLAYALGKSNLLSQNTNATTGSNVTSTTTANGTNTVNPPNIAG